MCFEKSAGRAFSGIASARSGQSQLTSAIEAYVEVFCVPPGEPHLSRARAAGPCVRRMRVLRPSIARVESDSAIGGESQTDAASAAGRIGRGGNPRGRRLTAARIPRSPGAPRGAERIPPAPRVVCRRVEAHRRQRDRASGAAPESGPEIAKSVPDGGFRPVPLSAAAGILVLVLLPTTDELRRAPSK